MDSPNKKSGCRAVLIIPVLILLFGVFQLRKCLVNYSEVSGRPWAYSSDASAKLLVGTWNGKFLDPAGIEKQLTLEVFLPLTEKELDQKASRQHKRRVRSSDKQSFDGIATINSKLGQEAYEIFGSVEKSDHHRFSLDFSPQDESKRILPNQAARSITTGSWQSDSMSIQLSFTPLNADGSSSSSSEGVVENGQLVWKDSPTAKPVTVTLQRVQKL